MLATKACVEAFVCPTEDKQKVLKALKTITPIEPKQKKNSTKFGGELIVLNACTSKEDEIIGLIDTLKALDINFSNYTVNRNFQIMLNKQRAFLGEVVPGRGVKVSIRFSKEAVKDGLLEKLGD